MNIRDAIVGKPAKTSDERAEQINAREGIPIFGLDALSCSKFEILLPQFCAGENLLSPLIAILIA